MNVVYRSILKSARKLYLSQNPDASKFGRNWKLFSNKEYANKLIYDLLEDERPCMIGRFGSNELSCLLTYLTIERKSSGEAKKFIKGLIPPWWWEASCIRNMKSNAGFFSADIDQLERFSKLMLDDIPQLDVLGSWLKEEEFLSDRLRSVKRVVLEDLEPFFTTKPWTRALEGKNVLVVHPFAETIERQYAKRENLFDDDLLPSFNLKTIRAVQTLASNQTEFDSWFDALDYMKDKIDNIDYDICILGCGAYGFPLAAHVKRSGRKAVHLGGATQLLFGIKGRRWENYVVWPYMNLFNEYWVRPDKSEKPSHAEVVENACYW